MNARIGSHQRVESRPGGKPGAGFGFARKQACLEGGRQVQYLIADCDAGPWRLAIPPKNSERQVLNRKIGVRRVGALNPAAQVGPVCLVELHALTL